MHLKQLKLTAFKNYEFEKFEFSPTINAFCGKNGMGKTNILDAIYYLCLTKSHFSSNDRNVAQHESPFFRIEGHFNTKDKQTKIVAKVEPRKSKVIERNGTAYQRLSEHVGFQPVVVTSPDDTILANGGSEERRRLLDNTLSQLDQSYLTNLMTYNRALQQRNALLKQMVKTGNYSRSLLEAIEVQMLAPADSIYQARMQFVEVFAPIVQSTYALISSKDEQVDCTYKSQLHEQSLNLLFDERREKDRILQRTTGGIHRDDLVFLIEGHPIRKFGSQGQLKTFVLSLKFAQYLLLQKISGKQPLLLLDDVFDKLDPVRVQNLLVWLSEAHDGKPLGQIFLTDTDQKRIESVLPAFSESKIFQIENGSITSENTLTST